MYQISSSVQKWTRVVDVPLNNIDSFILALSTLKAFAEVNVDVAEIVKLYKILEYGGNSGLPAFSVSPTIF